MSEFDPTLILDFADSRAKQLPFEWLEKSQNIIEATGRAPRTRPIVHYDLLAQTMQLLDSNQVSYTQPEIWVSRNGNVCGRRKENPLNIPDNHISN